MPTPTTPKKSSPAAKKSTTKTTGTRSRTRRTPKRSVTTAKTANEANQDANTSPKAKALTGQSEQLIILVAALGFGLVGLAVHFLWFVSIVLMALLVGLIGSEARRQRGHGLVAEVVAEARAVADDIATSAHDSENRPGPDSPPEAESAGQ
jgi:hypothetical protein